MGFIMDITQGRRLCQAESRIKLKERETKEGKFEVLVKSAEQVAVINWAATTGKFNDRKMPVHGCLIFLSSIFLSMFPSCEANGGGAGGGAGAGVLRRKQI